MIPKIINYCWFGHGKMPDLAIKCIASWKEYLPEYKMILWNEDSFDINSVPYVKEAYEAKKYAFVTDYVRLYALYNMGGIYMDTDVEVLKPLDCFLHLPAFSGFEDINAIPTGIMASEKEGAWVKIQLDHYKDKRFIRPNGELDLTTNVTTITNIMVAGGFVLNNKKQNYQNIITIFPKDYFCPKSYITGKIELTSNTHTIHHFAGSWLNKSDKMKSQIRKLIPRKIITFLKK